mmetsp:Transcript_74178/g.204735  ORF Transcript_74178/g.204735 Transcript_74178/m.204735 type:complete len:82 (-) Transcript_74178:57-302(-)
MAGAPPAACLAARAIFWDGALRWDNAASRGSQLPAFLGAHTAGWQEAFAQKKQCHQPHEKQSSQQQRQKKQSGQHQQHEQQ